MRYVRAGEKAFKIWAPIKRRPTEEQAAEREAAGRTVKREPSGRPAVQVAGFGLANTFDPLSPRILDPPRQARISLQSTPREPGC
ncbi:hypothetical protein [Micromonospora sp. NPDC005806]|uniref:hypothetical protein n=1 Tax=Micromonospora sp. NPDC005806 TaxID=3364234 RepID=UPI0036975569